MITQQPPEDIDIGNTHLPVLLHSVLVLQMASLKIPQYEENNFSHWLNINSMYAVAYLLTIKRFQPSFYVLVVIQTICYHMTQISTSTCHFNKSVIHHYRCDWLSSKFFWFEAQEHSPLLIILLIPFQACFLTISELTEIVLCWPLEHSH